ncbi:Carbohydrate binding module (family 6) [Catalinimonas alkaloidigena]|uniref:Carbohydrate binding module (Family 6) n=1 Tax=Catalinimonas alkaloidigena TaxID=1075417 RepID=A0A1G8XI79_9BACT|nr:DUF1553 domain-containing protein [Catalinimonas alkaloidigena]SDJ90166.1 Carbohydrate binding module (family 6) [Catalinimonas alkaloidigena]
MPLKPTTWLWSTGLALAAGIGSYALLHREPPLDFNADVRPILNQQCIACHGGVKRSGGFSLLFREEALAPTESGKPAIVPGDPDGSEFIRRLTLHDPEERMPLDAPPLSEAEIQTLRQWIKQGAAWEDHWAYLPPRSAEAPPDTSGWARNALDQFVLSRLQAAGLRPNPEADRATLLRRVSLDLTGLPPRWEDVQAFQQDTSPDAYEKVVDRLLASPHFGERWASLWLDLARYADTKGYEKDQHRNIWRFRDYVIGAFNADKPFDEFTREQLAGDLLPHPTDTQLIATAFHRNTTNNDEGGTDDEEFRTAAILDRVNTTWEVWQGTTMGCVQCHSHPYDPFRHEEYYQLMAFFNNTRDEDVPDESPTLKQFAPEDSSKLASLRRWVAQHTAPQHVATQLATLDRTLRITEPKVHPHSFDSLTKAALSDNKYLAVDHQGFARIPHLPLRGASQALIRHTRGQPGGRIELRCDAADGPLLGTLAFSEKGERFQTTLISLQPTPGIHDVYFVFHDPRRPTGNVAQLEWVVFGDVLPGATQPGFGPVKDTLLALLNEGDRTPILYENPDDFFRTTQQFERGNWLVKGDTVTPGVPHALADFPETLPRNRLGLAQWLVSADNPLTARVTVNRFWEQLFGTGLVETVEDFGTQGAKPSHPQLLDWLAVQFQQEYGWRIKPLLRTLVTSAAYRQASTFTPEKRELDPANRLLSRGPRVRLSAEMLRDQALAVSGLLSEKIGGPSVMPPQPDGIWQVVYSGMEWRQSEGEDAFRRGLYTYWRRSTPYPSMVTFDAPVREVCVSRRIRTNTPLQALVLLNDTVYVTAARALAHHAARHSAAPDEALRQAYRQALLREPDTRQLAVLRQLYDATLATYQQTPDEARRMLGLPATAAPPPSFATVAQSGNAPVPPLLHQASLTVVANALLNLDAFVTKE